MLSFENDYNAGAHPLVLKALMDTNLIKEPGYGNDDFCRSAAEKIRAACVCPEAEVYFISGGTQTNQVVISSLLRSYEGVLSAVSGHVNGHEAGAIEYSGHKVLTLPQHQGKIDPAELEAWIKSFYADESHEHMVFPGMVYISHPTEYGTLYSKAELEGLSQVCRRYALPLFLDGARLGYGLMAKGNDLTLPDIARLCDVFYIGGTKVGALFGEAVVICCPALKEDFRYLIKQHGGMLAKGRLLGVQFDALMTDNLYFEISAQADALADRLRDTLLSLNVPFLVPGVTNQLFPILPDSVLDKLSETYVFCEQQRVDETHRAVRFCTSWATREEAVDALCGDLILLFGKN